MWNNNPKLKKRKLLFEWNVRIILQFSINNEVYFLCWLYVCPCRRFRKFSRYQFFGKRKYL